jgi:hypothetical protein
VEGKVRCVKLSILSAVLFTSIACAVTPVEPASADTAVKSAREGEWNAERKGAFKTLTGVDYPEFLGEMEQFCRQQSMPKVEFIEAVEGYAMEGVCSNFPRCAEPILRRGYKYVETELKRSRWDQYPFNGKYRLSLKPAGDPNCEAYEAYLAGLSDSLRLSALVPGEGECLAAEPIEEFAAKYLVRRGKTFRDQIRDIGYSQSQEEIIDRTTGETAALARNLSFGERNDDYYFTFACRALRDGMINAVIPPIR